VHFLVDLKRRSGPLIEKINCDRSASLINIGLKTTVVSTFIDTKTKTTLISKHQYCFSETYRYMMILCPSQSREAAGRLRGTRGGGLRNGSGSGSRGHTTGGGGTSAGFSSDGSSDGSASDTTGAGGKSAGRS
jgi:hypothetical protein